MADSARLGLRLGSVLFEARLSPRLGSLQLGGLDHLDPAWLDSARLGSAQLGSPGYLGFGSSRLDSARNLIRSQLRLSSGMDSGFATRDLAGPGSGLNSAHLDWSLARFISARLILAGKFLHIV